MKHEYDSIQKGDIMDLKESIQKSYEYYLETLEMQDADDFRDTLDNRYGWLSSWFFDVTTYDGDLDIEFGKNIYEVMLQIYNRTVFDYIKDENKYKTYIIVCNLFISFKLLDWGTSIRSAWFDFGEYHPYLLNGAGHINISEDCIKYLLFEFLI